MRPQRPARPSRWFLHQPWASAPLVALDFETTGLNVRRDAVISFGAVPISSGRIELGKALYREVRPDVPPSSASIAVHHLRPVDLREAPSMAEARDDLRAALDRRYIVTWFGEVEANFLTTVFGASSMHWLRRMVDAFPMVRALDRLTGDGPEGGIGSLEDTAERFGVPGEEAHHALDDAVMTAELFLVVATKLAAALRDDRLRSLRRAAGDA